MWTSIRTFATRFVSRHRDDDHIVNEPLLQRYAGTDLYDQKDTYNIVYWIFFLYGVAMLLPWNVFITASEYFARRFQGSGYETSFQNYFSTFFTITNLGLFALILQRQYKSYSNVRVDVIIPLALNSAVFGIMALTVMIDAEGAGYFWLSLTLLVLTSATTSIFQASVFSVVSLFPAQYIQAVMSGQGVAGVAVAVSSIASALAGSSDKSPDDAAISRAAFIYFLSALFVTIVAFGGRLVLTWQPYYSHHEKMLQSTTDAESDSAYASPSESSTSTEFSSTLRKVSTLTAAIILVFTVTLAVFPSLTALIKSVETHPPNELGWVRAQDASRWLDDDVFIALHFFIFSAGDWMGRTLPTIKATRISCPRTLLFLSFSRIVFIPLFLICNVVTGSARHYSVLIGSDVLYMFIVFVFATSNGYLGSLIMMTAPQIPAIQHPAEKSLVGNLMNFALLIGLALGGSLSFAVRPFA